MLRAHRQAWAWMDEWWGLTIEDIRNIEKETQNLLAKKYGQGETEEDGAQSIRLEGGDGGGRKAILIKTRKAEEGSQAGLQEFTEPVGPEGLSRILD